MLSKGIVSTGVAKSIRTAPIRQAMRNIPRPVCIISTITSGKDYAITASSAQDFNAKGKNYIMFNVIKNTSMGAQFIGSSEKKFSINLLNKVIERFFLILSGPIRNCKASIKAKSDSNGVNS